MYSWDKPSGKFAQNRQQKREMKVEQKLMMFEERDKLQGRLYAFNTALVTILNILIAVVSAAMIVSTVVLGGSSYHGFGWMFYAFFTALFACAAWSTYGIHTEIQPVIRMSTLLFIVILLVEVIVTCVGLMNGSVENYYLGLAWDSAANQARVAVQESVNCCGWSTFGQNIGDPCPVSAKFPCLPLVRANWSSYFMVLGVTFGAMAITQLIIVLLSCQRSSKLDRDRVHLNQFRAQQLQDKYDQNKPNQKDDKQLVEIALN